MKGGWHVLQVVNNQVVSNVSAGLTNFRVLLRRDGWEFIVDGKDIVIVWSPRDHVRNRLYIYVKEAA